MPRHPPMSDHLALEIAVAFKGTRLNPGAPVPGCSCVRCQVLTVGGDEADVLEAELAIVVLSRLSVNERAAEARRWAEDRERCGREATLPSPGVLALLAAREPGSVRWSSDAHDDAAAQEDLDGAREWKRQVEEARNLSVLDVVRRYVGEPVHRGRSWLVTCPFHVDEEPSLSIDPDKGLWYCFPCGFGGDGIELVMCLRRVDFATAVRELAA